MWVLLCGRSTWVIGSSFTLLRFDSRPLDEVMTMPGCWGRWKVLFSVETLFPPAGRQVLIGRARWSIHNDWESDPSMCFAATAMARRLFWGQGSQTPSQTAHTRKVPSPFRYRHLSQTTWCNPLFESNRYRVFSVLQINGVDVRFSWSAKKRKKKWSAKWTDKRQQIHKMVEKRQF